MKTWKEICDVYGDSEELRIERIFWPMLESDMDHLRFELEAYMNDIESFIAVFGLGGTPLDERFVKGMFTDGEPCEDLIPDLYRLKRHGLLAKVLIPVKENFSEHDYSTGCAYHMEFIYFEDAEQFGARAQELVADWEKKDREQWEKKLAEGAPC